MQAPKESSKTNTYNILQQLIGLAPQQQLLVLGMKMERKKNLYNSLYTFFNSSSLFAFVRKFCLTMFMLIFLVFSFLHVWCLKLF
jgi:predicted amidohydrolase